MQSGDSVWQAPFPSESGSHAKLAQVMIDVAIAPDQPIALAELAENGVFAEGGTVGESIH